MSPWCSYISKISGTAGQNFEFRSCDVLDNGGGENHWNITDTQHLISKINLPQLAGFSSLHESVKNQTNSFYITVDNKPNIPQMNQTKGVWLLITRIIALWRLMYKALHKNIVSLYYNETNFKQNSFKLKTIVGIKGLTLFLVRVLL